METWYQFLRKQVLVVFLITDQLIIWWNMEPIYKKKHIGKNFNICVPINHLFLNLFSSYCCRNPRCQPTSFRPRFLLVEDPGCGQAFHLAPAVIHALEKFPVYTLDLPALFVSTTSPEETCAQVSSFSLIW